MNYLTLKVAGPLHVCQGLIKVRTKGEVLKPIWQHHPLDNQTFCRRHLQSPGPEHILTSQYPIAVQTPQDPKHADQAQRDECTRACTNAAQQKVMCVNDVPVWDSLCNSQVVVVTSSHHDLTRIIITKLWTVEAIPRVSMLICYPFRLWALGHINRTSFVHHGCAGPISALLEPDKPWSCLPGDFVSKTFCIFGLQKQWSSIVI